MKLNLFYCLFKKKTCFTEEKLRILLIGYKQFYIFLDD